MRREFSLLIERKTVLIILGVIILGIGIALIPRRYGDASDASICRGLYRHAPTYQDTLVIDAQRAPEELGRMGRETALTCGALRRLGKVAK